MRNGGINAKIERIISSRPVCYGMALASLVPVYLSFFSISSSPLWTKTMSVTIAVYTVGLAVFCEMERRKG